MGGKGGVGKTSCAAAFGLIHARRRQRTLVVSTDPAPSLGDAFGRRLSAAPRPIPGSSGFLHAVEIDAPAAMRRWLRGRRAILETIALRGTWLEESDVSAMLGHSLPGLDELAALFEVLRFVRSGRYDLVILDTAPTGHTLRLLQLPGSLAGIAHVFDHMQARHRAVVSALRGGWIGDEADALITELETDAGDLGALLRDRERTRLSLVTLPETLALEETLDAVRALQRIEIRVDEIIVNRLTPTPPDPCGWCQKRRAQERRVVAGLLQRLSRHFAARERPLLAYVAALEREPVGPRALRPLAAALANGVLRARGPRASATTARPSFSTLADGARCEWLGAPGIRLLVFGGKGGVGKTTCAAAAALDAARRDSARRVLLLSTDPAHSLADVLAVPLSDAARKVDGGPANLVARELDAFGALDRLRRDYAAAIDRVFDRLTRNSGVDAAADRRAMHDLLELAPPGLDEIAAVLDVLDLLDHAPSGATVGYELIVADTAPTGHALRLLEMPQLLQQWVHTFMRIVLKYQPVVGAGELGAALLRLSQGLGRLRRTLTDGRLTQFVVATRAAALPRAETMRMLSRLARLGIPVSCVIVNAVGAGTCGRCVRATRRENHEIAALRRSTAAARLVLAPSSVPPPRAPQALDEWRRRWRVLT